MRVSKLNPHTIERDQRPEDLEKDSAEPSPEPERRPYTPPDENSLPNPHAAWVAAFKRFGIDPNRPDALEWALTLALLELGRVAPKRFPEFTCHWPEPIDDQSYNRWVQANAILDALKKPSKAVEELAAKFAAQLPRFDGAWDLVLGHPERDAFCAAMREEIAQARTSKARLSQNKAIEVAFHNLSVESRGHVRSAASLKTTHKNRAEIERIAEQTPDLVLGWAKRIGIIERTRAALSDVVRPLPALTSPDIHYIVQRRSMQRHDGRVTVRSQHTGPVTWRDIVSRRRQREALLAIIRR